jgi:hypothetical protein
MLKIAHVGSKWTVEMITIDARAKNDNLSNIMEDFSVSGGDEEQESVWDLIK